ncbi:MAG: flippase [Colwellia sp.]|nr:flippase [Colwellia sp.]
MSLFKQSSNKKENKKVGNNALFNYANEDNKEIVSSAAIIFSLKLFAALFGFVVSVVITRFLSVEDAGYYFFVLSMIALLSTVGRVGVDNAIVRFMAVANKAQDHGQISHVFLLSMHLVLKFSLLIAVILMPLVFFLYCYFFGGELSYYLMLIWLVLLIPLTSMSTVIVQSFQGVKRVIPFALLNNVLRPLNLMGLLIVISMMGTLTLNLALSVYYIGIMTTVGIGYYYWRKSYPAADATTISSSFKVEFHQASFSLWGLTCLAIVMGQGAQVLLGVFSDGEQLAYFAVANRIAILVAIVLLALNGILSPKFAEIFAENDKKRLQDIYRSSTRIMLFFTSPILLVAFFFAPQILALFGPDYVSASLVLRILVAGQFVKVAVGSVGQLLIMSGFERVQRFNLFIAVTILVFLSVLLMPSYGALGGAIATFFAMTINNVLGLIKVYQKLNIKLIG